MLLYIANSIRDTSKLWRVERFLLKAIEKGSDVFGGKFG